MALNGDAKKSRIEIPGYEVLSLIGKGAMGTVYKARQLSLDREVAVKAMSPKLSTDKRYLDKFYTEARAVANLRHRNIISGIDVFESSGQHYFVMEYVNGVTIRQKLDVEGRLSIEEAVQIIAQTAEALEYAHNNGIIHRDVKPDNIIIDIEGQAKLCDLGLAKKISSEMDPSAAGKAEGTPHYISPEQAVGAENVGQATDMYSLGATFYHIITGRTPFKGGSAREIMLQHVTSKPESVRSIRPEIPESYAKIIEKMMDHNPENRFSDMGKLITALKRGLLVKPKRLSGRLDSSPSWQKAAIIAGIVGVIAIFLIIAIGRGGSRGSDDNGTSVSYPKRAQTVAPDIVKNGDVPQSEPDEEDNPPVNDKPEKVEDAFAGAAGQEYLSIQSYKVQNPGKHREFIAKLRDFLKRYPNTEISGRVKGEIDVAIQMLETDAKDFYFRVKGDVEQKIREKNFKEAVELALLPKGEYPETEWGNKSDELVKLVQDALTNAYSRDIAKVNSYFEEKKYMKALEELGFVEKYAPQSESANIESLRRKIEYEMKTNESAAAFEEFEKEYDKLFFMAVECYSSNLLYMAANTAKKAIESGKLKGDNLLKAEVLFSDTEAMARALARLVKGVEEIKRRSVFVFRDGQEVDGRLRKMNDEQIELRPSTLKDTEIRELREFDLDKLVWEFRRSPSVTLSPEESYENGILLIYFTYPEGAKREIDFAVEGGVEIPGRIKSFLEMSEDHIGRNRSFYLEKLGDYFLNKDMKDKALSYFKRVLTQYYKYCGKTRLLGKYIGIYREIITAKGLEGLINGKLKSSSGIAAIQLDYDFGNAAEAEDWVDDEGGSPEIKSAKIEVGKTLTLRPIWEGDIQVTYKFICADPDVPNMNLFLGGVEGNRGWFFGIGARRDPDSRTIEVNPDGGRRYNCALPADMVVSLRPNMDPGRVYYASNRLKYQPGKTYTFQAIHYDNTITFKAGSVVLASFKEDVENDKYARVILMPFTSRFVVSSVSIVGTIDKNWITGEIDRRVNLEKRAIERLWE